MLQINLGKLKNKNKSIIDQLENNLGIKLRSNGNILILDTDKIRKKDIKLALKKILHSEGLKETNRVLVIKETISIVEVKNKE